MEEKYQKIWELALPYLKKGIKKDFVLHTKGVVKAMNLLLDKIQGNNDLLIICAILHDVGWSKVPNELQVSKDKDKRIEGLKLHIKYAEPIIIEILNQLNFDENFISQVIEIVKAHKFQDPKELNKQLLIDADAMSDAFEEQFLSDAKSYNQTLQDLAKYRLENNKFYSKDAEIIFSEELNARLK